MHEYAASPSMAAWILSLLPLLPLLLVYSPPVVDGSGKVPTIIVFGDSSVDSGNNNFIDTPAKSNYEPYGRDFYGGRPTGRFSNGLLATDFISQAFKLLPSVPAYLDPAYSIKDFATGVCFASAATGYDNATSNVMSVIPLWKELMYFKEYIGKLKGYQGEAKASETIREALYVISIGTNDFLENYYTLPGRSGRFTVGEYQRFLINIAEKFVNEIYWLGARKIDLTGLPPMGCLPLERSTNFRLFSFEACNAERNTVARGFNFMLQRLGEKLNMERQGLSLVYGNVYDILESVLKSPSTFGFEVTAVGCCGASGLVEMGFMCRSPLTCVDANQYVFWDAIHPTQKMNQIIADHIVQNALARFM